MFLYCCVTFHYKFVSIILKSVWMETDLAAKVMILLSVTRTRLGIALTEWRAITSIWIRHTWRRSYSTTRWRGKSCPRLIATWLAGRYSRLGSWGDIVVSRLRSLCSVCLWWVRASRVLLRSLWWQLLCLALKVRCRSLGCLLTVTRKLLRCLWGCLLTVA